MRLIAWSISRCFSASLAPTGTAASLAMAADFPSNKNLIKMQKKKMNKKGIQ